MRTVLAGGMKKEPFLLGCTCENADVMNVLLHALDKIPIDFASRYSCEDTAKTCLLYKLNESDCPVVKELLSARRHVSMLQCLMAAKLFYHVSVNQ